MQLVKGQNKITHGTRHFGSQWMCSGKELSHALFEAIGVSHCKKNTPKTCSVAVWKFYS